MTDEQKAALQKIIPMTRGETRSALESLLAASAPNPKPASPETLSDAELLAHFQKPPANPSDKQEAKPQTDAEALYEAWTNAIDTGTGVVKISHVPATEYAAPLAQSAEQDRIDAEYREVGVWEPDGSKFKTYRNENLNGVAMYVREAKGASK